MFVDRVKSISGRKCGDEPTLHKTIVPFDVIWSSMHVEQELEDAYAALMSSHSQIRTVKEAFTKLTLGHIQAVEKWQLDADKAASEPPDAVSEIGRLNTETTETFDVVLAKRNLARAKELLKQVTESSENEDRLMSHWQGLYRCMSDVNAGARDYVMRLSTRLDELGDRLARSLDAYRRREEEIVRDAERTLEARITQHFCAYRLSRLKRIQRRVQQKHDEDIDEKLRQFRAENERRAVERAAMDALRTEISRLRVELSAQPLIRHRKIAVLEDELLEKRTTATLLEAKLARKTELTEKRKTERKERIFVEKVH